MSTATTNLTLRKATFITIFGYLLMFSSPIAEFAVYHKLVDLNDAKSTSENILANLSLFRHGVMLYLINFIGDIIAAWGLYYLLKPVSNSLSMFTACLRIIFAIISLVATMNLLTVLQLLEPHVYLKVFTTEQLQAQIMIALRSFRDDWSFCYVFFGLYLILLGYLAFISKYISKIVGISLVIAGLGWLIDSVQPFLFPNTNISVGMIAGVGELVLLIWLCSKGWRLQEPI